jgi:ATPase subunit of ABC transporter with duplicated ATPase domains
LPHPLRAAAAELDRVELEVMETDDEATQMRYAEALSTWGELGGYPAEVLWDTVTVAALGVRYDHAKHREVRTLSGGEQKRLVLEALLRGPEQVLLLDEPTDNLDLSSAEALRSALEEFPGTVVAVTHDRWFARSFNRYLLFRSDGVVSEVDEPVWDEARVQRSR